MRSSPIRWVVLCALPALVGGVWMYGFSGEREHGKRLAAVAVQPLTRTVTVSGVLYPKRRADVMIPPGGRVTEVLVRIGQHVRAGQTLARLESRHLKRQLERRQIALERARLKLSAPIAQSGEKSGHASGDGERLALLDLRQAELDYDEAREALDATVIIARADGVVSHVGIEAGNIAGPLVASTLPAIMIADENVFIVEAEGDEFDVADVQPGQSAEVFIESSPSQPVPGTIASPPVLKRAANGPLASSVYGFVVELSEGPPITRMGSSAHVRIQLAKPRKALVVPVEAVFQHGSSSYLLAHFVDGVRPIGVRLGVTDDVHVELLDGPPLGTQVELIDPGRGAFSQSLQPGHD